MKTERNDKDQTEDRLLIFHMKNLMLERSLEELEDSGIAIGHKGTIVREETVDTDLFEHEILNKAVRMADFYVLYFSMENSVRKLITDVLNERHGPNWWEEKVPEGVRAKVQEKQQQEMDTAMSIRSEDPLAYATFGELIDIFNANWNDFSDILRSKKSVQDTLSQFNRIRNIVAHSCELNDDEILRFKLLIKDWLRIQT